MTATYYIIRETYLEKCCIIVHNHKSIKQVYTIYVKTKGNEKEKNPYLSQKVKYNPFYPQIAQLICKSISSKLCESLLSQSNLAKIPDVNQTAMKDRSINNTCRGTFKRTKIVATLAHFSLTNKRA